MPTVVRTELVIVAVALAAGVLGCSSTPHRDEVDPRPPPATMPPELMAHCSDGQDASAAFCRVNARISWARSRRDSVLVACLHGPHQRLQAIRDDMADAGPEGESRLGDVMTQRETMRLEREAEDCVR